jgi:hypothetical protein
MKTICLSYPTQISGRRFFFAAAIVIILFAAATISRAQNPSSGSVGPSGPAVTWVQTAPPNPGGGVNTESACVDGVNCEVFTLTVTGSTAEWAGQRVKVRLDWNSGLNEYDIYIHKDTLNGPLVTSAFNGPGLTSQTAYIDMTQNDPGVYVVHVAFDTTPDPTAPYSGTASAAPQTPPPPPPAPQDAGPKIGYENFEAPGVLTQVTQTSSGGLTVEYIGRGAGEPSIGSNWKSGVTNFQSDLETLFIQFDDSCSALPRDSWVNRRAPTSQFVDSDPIGFTDRDTGRVFAGELTLLSPDTYKTSYTDDDGLTWVPDQTGGLGSAVDHETVGGGPYHVDPNTGQAPPHSPTYPNAVYYCSQDIAAALCSRSDDGGLTYGPSIPIYNLSACQGLHGHVKVSPVDGTVYIPNRACGKPQSALVVSEDNGITWTIKPVENTTFTDTAATDDPAVGVDNAGKVYFAFAAGGTAAGVAVSDDKGATWTNIYDIGAVYGIKNVAFPAAVAGDAGRAAVAFYGSTTAVGDSNTGDFSGVWHLYVAHTFDGGSTWTTTDVTPTMPMQRSGLLRGGGGDTTRNLLDFFDMTTDRDGRVLVGYVNGCAGGTCAQAAASAKGNAYSTVASIARQSSGRRLLVAKTPMNATTVPGMPFLTVHRNGGTVSLAWNQSDTGNSAILGYKILRGTSSGTEVQIAGVGAGSTSYIDPTATDTTKTYYYRVAAVNAVGSSCPSNEVAAPYVGDSSTTGLIIHQNDPSHPEATGGSGGPPPAPELLIDYIAVGEPSSMPGMLMFKMKVGDLSTVPPNSRWRIAWDWWSSSDVQAYYAGMTSDQNGAVTFEYGSLADAVPSTVPVLVLGETKIDNADAASNYQADGTITIFVPKSGVGDPQPGDLLGAIGGKTMADNATTERSTQFVDHTFVKGLTDNSFPAATYMLAIPKSTMTVTVSPTQIRRGSSATYTIAASPAPSQPVTVSYSMSGSAVQGTDYTLSNNTGQITIPAGQSSVAVTLNAIEIQSKKKKKKKPAPNVTATMTLQAGDSYDLGSPSSATVTITP